MPTSKLSNFTKKADDSAVYDAVSFIDVFGTFARFPAPGGFSTTTVPDYNNIVNTLAANLDTQMGIPGGGTFSPLFTEVCQSIVPLTIPAYAVHATLNPGDNIQTNITASPNSRIIQLNPGSYTANNLLTFSGKSNIVLVGLGTNPEDTEIRLNTASGIGIDINTCPGIEFHNLYVNGNNGQQDNRVFYARNSSTSCVWHKVRIRNTQGHGISIETSSNNCIVQSCDIGHNFPSPTTSRDGINTSGSSGIIVRDNTVANIKHVGIFFSSNSTNGIIECNRVRHCGAHNFQTRGSGHSVRFNIFFNNSGDIGSTFYDGSGNGIYVSNGASGTNQIYNNIVYNSVSAGIDFDGDSGITGTYNLFNNLFACFNQHDTPAGGSGANNLGGMRVKSIDSGAMTIRSHNNIFYGNVSGSPRAYHFVIATARTNANLTLQSNYNAFFDTLVTPRFRFQPGAGFQGIATGDYADLAAWQAASSLDANSVQVDPALNGECTGNALYEDTNGGPMINAGTVTIGGSHISVHAPEYSGSLSNISIGPMTEG